MKENNQTKKPSDILVDLDDIQEAENTRPVNNAGTETSDDSDMPEPDTKNYNNDSQVILKPTWLFLKLFTQCTDRMPYASILQNSKGDKIKLMDLVHFVEAKENGITVSDMDIVISFLAPCKKEYVRELMELVESKEHQSKLWTVVQ